MKRRLIIATAAIKILVPPKKYSCHTKSLTNRSLVTVISLDTNKNVTLAYMTQQ